MSGPWQREDFLRLDSEVPYFKSRVLDPTKPYSGLENLKVGEEYILRMQDSQRPSWGEDNVDEVMKYAGDMGSGLLGHVLPIELPVTVKSNSALWISVTWTDFPSTGGKTYERKVST